MSVKDGCTVARNLSHALSVAEPICISQLKFTFLQIISTDNCHGQTMKACGIRL
jgi:hypothetical protein